MSKPILFETISREKYNDLTPEQKAAKNYQIKETDGSVSKAIGGLEGGGSGGAGLKYFEVSWDTGEDHLYTVNTIEEIDAYYQANGPFGVHGIVSGSGVTQEFYIPEYIQRSIEGEGINYWPMVSDSLPPGGLVPGDASGYTDYYELQV